MKPLAGDYCGRTVTWALWLHGDAHPPLYVCDAHKLLASEGRLVIRVRRAPTGGDQPTAKGAITSGCKYKPHAARPAPD